MFEHLKVQGDWTAASGYNAMMKLLERDPTWRLFLFPMIRWPWGRCRLAATYGRSVPHDLAVVGFDDIPESAYFSPPLTTVRQDLLEVGCRAVSLLITNFWRGAAMNRLLQQVSIVEPQLIVRQSSYKETP